MGDSALNKCQVNRLSGNERKRGIQDAFKLVHLRRWKRGVASSCSRKALGKGGLRGKMRSFC